MESKKGTGGAKRAIKSPDKLAKTLKKRPDTATKKSAAPKAAAAAKKPSPLDRASRSSAELLRAGLSALTHPGTEAAVAGGLSRIADSFGLRKLEDVFDQRVAAALQRLGYPSPEELRSLPRSGTKSSRGGKR